MVGDASLAMRQVVCSSPAAPWQRLGSMILVSWSGSVRQPSSAVSAVWRRVVSVVARAASCWARAMPGVP